MTDHTAKSGQVCKLYVSPVHAPQGREELPQTYVQEDTGCQVYCSQGSWQEIIALRPSRCGLQSRSGSSSCHCVYECFSVTCVHRRYRRHSNIYPTQTIRRSEYGLCTTKRLWDWAIVSFAAGAQHQPRHNASTPQEIYIIANSRASLPARLVGLLQSCSSAVMKHKSLMQLPSRWQLALLA